MWRELGRSETLCGIEYGFEDRSAVLGEALSASERLDLCHLVEQKRSDRGG
jgi:hypothetical protein